MKQHNLSVEGITDHSDINTLKNSMEVKKADIQQL